MKQILCRQCGEPYTTQKVFDQISKAFNHENFNPYRDSTLLCQNCRKDAFARHLIGDRLNKVERVRHVASRREEGVKPKRLDQRTGATVYKSQCYICNSGCDATVWVKDGKVVRVEGDPSSPVTKGTLCAKGLASTHILYHPDRLRYPLKRVGERGEGKWKRISWDEALDHTAARLKEIEGRYGKDSIVLSQGTGRGWIFYFSRFANAYGKQWMGPGIAQCQFPRTTSQLLVLGGIALDSPDYTQTECMLVWGANPPATWPWKALGMMDAWGRGAKLIVVDPVLTETVSKAHLWLKLRPGTDTALALGMLNVIIREGLYDKEFVEKWCVGFNELKERAREYPPDKVEDITWVPKEKMIEAARIYARTKPASITQLLAIDQNADTISSSRALAMLASITGNIDVPGGNILGMPKPVVSSPYEYGQLKHLTKEDHERRLGSREYPLLSGEAALFYPSAHNATVWKAVLEGDPYPVRAIYCHGNNMVSAYGNTKKVIRALESLDFFVVADLFMTPTAELADIVFPAASWMERDTVSSSGQVSFNHVHLQQKTIQVDECWTDYKILNEMAKRLGFADRMFESDEDHCDYILGPSGMTFEDFKKKGIISIPQTYRKYEDGGFKTFSGKVELYSQRLKDLDFDPLPDYREPTESPVSNPELAEKYPLILTTGAREPVFRHSELRNIPVLREIWPEPRMKINPKVAEELGISEGDSVIVETLRGSMEATAWLREDIDPRIVQVPSHWPGKNNVNLITDDENCAPMIGSTQLRCQLCRIRRGAAHV